MDSKLIKKNFDLFRQKKGVTMRKLAADLGVTEQTIYSYFRDGITLRTLEKAAALVGCEPWQLLKPNDQEKQPEQAQPQTICPHCGKTIFLTAHKTQTENNNQDKQTTPEQETQQQEQEQKNEPFNGTLF